MTGPLARADVHGEAARKALRVLIVYTIGTAAFATHPPMTDFHRRHRADVEQGEGAVRAKTV